MAAAWAAGIGAFSAHLAHSRVLGAMTGSALMIAPLGGLAAGFLTASAGMTPALLAAGCYICLSRFAP
jgi:hypothetical protein